MNRQTVLVVDDDPRSAHLLRLLLEPRGYRVTAVADGRETQAAVERERPAVVVLDLMMPEVDGFEICRQLRTRSLVPIIVVTARGDQTTRLQCLRLGADDVLTKPYHSEELVLRLEGIIRRATGGAPATPEPYAFRGLVVDFTGHRSTLHGRDLSLTPLEQRLLETLARQPGVVQLADDLLDRIWGPHAVGQYATLYLHISRLRRKLGDDGRRAVYLLTRSRIGYLLPAAEAESVMRDA